MANTAVDEGAAAKEEIIPTWRSIRAARRR
jgi:hypothetical protein